MWGLLGSRLLPRARLALAGGVFAGAATTAASLCEYSAPQRTNPQWKQKMKDGSLFMGCAVNTSSSLVAELVASIGYDFVLIDHQHSAIDSEKLRHMITAVHAGRIDNMDQLCLR